MTDVLVVNHKVECNELNCSKDAVFNQHVWFQRCAWDSVWYEDLCVEHCAERAKEWLLNPKFSKIDTIRLAVDTTQKEKAKLMDGYVYGAGGKLELREKENV